jgi:N-acetylneuraminic acid mutarotase
MTNGGVFVADVTAYDPTTDTWAALPSLPAIRKSGVGGVLGGRTVFATGLGPTGSSTQAMSDTWSGPVAGGWESGPPMPAAMSEVAGGVIGRSLYLVGEYDNRTWAYDLGSRQWTVRATRPLVGNHHAAEVVGGRLYLFGGLGGGSSGKVQIYDSGTDTWSLGADMPFAAGSSSSAVIGGKVYVAGGIVGNATTAATAAYDPAANSWTSKTAMPEGRNHTASGTDGTKLYVFGGRGPGSGDGNAVANGFAELQVYDPATDRWATSDDAGSDLLPLPQARGGMGKAVYAAGELYVMGGETSTGAGATADKVYKRVDVYDVAAGTWRQGSPMPTGRHGIFPLGAVGRAFVAGGGTRSGGLSQTSVLEVLDL